MNHERLQTIAILLLWLAVVVVWSVILIDAVRHLREEF